MQFFFSSEVAISLVIQGHDVEPYPVIAISLEYEIKTHLAPVSRQSFQYSHWFKAPLLIWLTIFYM